ncbi:hypothetical protein QX249_11760 [Vibrio parahaemolyticus]|uniref:Uncharacterized protein n=1 Tax=Vibrio parahaemolyticus TaxID=670 RepID=A0AAW8PYR3_VIBPH|nr:hypothetical protein [Vibrio parahaemolyticus]MDS1821342.1 hypothetical protein [Vibrio parahaemolyticus]
MIKLTKMIGTTIFFTIGASSLANASIIRMQPEIDMTEDAKLAGNSIIEIAKRVVSESIPLEQYKDSNGTTYLAACPLNKGAEISTFASACKSADGFPVELCKPLSVMVHCDVTTSEKLSFQKERGFYETLYSFDSKTGKFSENLNETTLNKINFGEEKLK